VMTPSLETGILEGITRGLVLRLARRDGLPVDEASLRPEDLKRADEGFITSTLKGILPIRRCDGWPIQTGRPGPITLRLIDRFDAAVRDPDRIEPG